jgi:hypothetical protein
MNYSLHIAIKWKANTDLECLPCYFFLQKIGPQKSFILFKDPHHTHDSNVGVIDGMPLKSTEVG